MWNERIERKHVSAIFKIAILLFSFANPIISCFVQHIFWDQLNGGEYTGLRLWLKTGMIIGFILKPVFYIILLAHPSMWIH